MLDLSLSELALITTVAVLVVDPKDLPVIARTCHKWWGELRAVTDEIKAGVQEIIEETGAEDIATELEQDAKHIADAPKYIEDQNGNLQRVYDISEMVKEAPLPLAGGERGRVSRHPHPASPAGGGGEKVSGPLPKGEERK